MSCSDVHQEMSSFVTIEETDVYVGVNAIEKPYGGVNRARLWSVLRMWCGWKPARGREELLQRRTSATSASGTCFLMLKLK